MKLIARCAKYATDDYPFSVNDFLRLLDEQDFRCSICGWRFGSLSAANIEHDHDSGKVRSLACVGCNLALSKIANIPDWPDRLRNYLKEHAENLQEST